MERLDYAGCGIYLIENTVSPLFYVGQTINFQHRWSTHKHALNNKSRRANKRLRNSWVAHGESAFQFIILEHCDKAVLTQREIFWLDLYRSMYPGKIANSAGPTDNPMRGSKHTLEALAKISLAFTGIPKSPEHRAKIGAAQKGRKKSEHEIAAIKASKTGKPNRYWLEGNNPSQQAGWADRFSGDNNPARRAEVRAKMVLNSGSRRGVRDKHTGETWTSMSACASDLGVSVSAVHAAATKRILTVKGRVIDRWFNSQTHKVVKREATAP